MSCRVSPYLFAIALAAASLGCKAEDKAEGQAEETAESPTQEPAGEAEAVEPAAAGADSEEAPADCKVFVEETRKACSDMYRKGLDINCLQQVMFVDRAREQAGGNLFDLGSDEANAQVSKTLCQGQIDDLREAYAEAGQLAERDWSEQCLGFISWFEDQCLAKLGKETMPQKCRSLLTMTQDLEPGSDRAKATCQVYESM